MQDQQESPMGITSMHWAGFQEVFFLLIPSKHAHVIHWKTNACKTYSWLRLLALAGFSCIKQVYLGGSCPQMLRSMMPMTRDSPSPTQSLLRKINWTGMLACVNWKVQALHHLKNKVLVLHLLVFADAPILVLSLVIDEVVHYLPLLYDICMLTQCKYAVDNTDW